MDIATLRVLGIDFSTRSIDFVSIPFEDEANDLNEASYRAVGLQRRKNEDSFQVALRVRERMAGLLGWDSIALTYIEQPYSQNRRTLATLSLIEGAIIASLPLVVRRGAINEISAQEWKRVLCGRADASKDAIREVVEDLGFERGLPQDACDAAGIAWAARHENARALLRARVF